MELYEKDSFCRQFTSRVLSCQKRAETGTYVVVLEETAFYPEGGGQPSDIGTLNQLAVTYVEKSEGEIFHHIREELPVGGEVEGVIQWERRFDLMQQHSGEHIISGIAHHLYGCDNVGFHMGAERITIDFNRPLTWEQLMEIEERANQYIWENHPVCVSYPTPVELAALPYRSKKAITGSVRIVTFPEGGDCCACCGTHVTHTGQIGLVKLISSQGFRKGVRVELLCGKRAMDYLTHTAEQNTQVAKKLSVTPLQTEEAVSRLWDEKESLSYAVEQMERRWILALTQLYQGKAIVFVEDISVTGLRLLATEIASTAETPVACFSGAEGAYSYAVVFNKGSIAPLIQDLNTRFSGRGGGKGALAQGKVQGKREDISAFLRQAFDLLLHG